MKRVQGASPDSVLRILLSRCLSWMLEGDPNLTLDLIDPEPFWNEAVLLI